MTFSKILGLMEKEIRNNMFAFPIDSYSGKRFREVKRKYHRNIISNLQKIYIYPEILFTLFIGQNLPTSLKCLEISKM